MRYESNYQKGTVSLEEYIKKMVPNQNTIYFVFGTNKDAAMNNPFMEAFQGTDIPVLVLTT